MYLAIPKNEPEGREPLTPAKSHRIMVCTWSELRGRVLLGGEPGRLSPITW